MSTNMPWQLQEAEEVPHWVTDELDQLQGVLQSRDADVSDLLKDMQQVMATANAATEEVTHMQTKVCCCLHNNMYVVPCTLHAM